MASFQWPTNSKFLQGIHLLSSTRRAAQHPSRKLNARLSWKHNVHSIHSTAGPPVPTSLTSTKRSTPPPTVVIFHNPFSAVSSAVLSVLREAQIAYPRSKFKTGPPLDLELTVLERLPNREELQDIYSLLNESSWTSFLRPSLAAESSGYRMHPTSARSLLEALEIMRHQELQKAKEQQPGHDFSANELGTKVGKPNTDHPLFGTDAFSWPVVVCWRAGQAAVGGPKRMHKMLKVFANIRDGIIVRSQAQIKAEEESKRTRFREPRQAVSPHEDDTLEWFNETNKRPVYKRATR